jgi:hypothetical protein
MQPRPLGPSTSSLARFALVLAALSLLPPIATGQTAKLSCRHFFDNLHQTTDCLEAIFSEDDKPLYTHLTVGSVPPGNGFSLGFLTADPTHFVSAFAPRTLPDMRKTNPQIFVVPSDEAPPDQPNSGGRKSLFVPRVSVAASTNGSWYATGGFDWLPPLYINSPRSGPVSNCNKLGKLCTDTVLTLHLEGTHSVARTINFYGLGPASPNTQYTFRLDQTYGGMQGRLPLADYHTVDTSGEFSVAAGIEAHHMQLPVEALPASVYTHFTAATLPGLTAQPAYIHSNAGFIDHLTHISEAQPRAGQLLKRRDAIALDSSFAYHWYSDTSSSAASFQQAVADVSFSLELGGIFQQDITSSATRLRAFFPHAFYSFVQDRCAGPPAKPPLKLPANPTKEDIEKAKKAAADYIKDNFYTIQITHGDRCDFGDVTLTAHLAASHAPGSNTIPFFMRPTVGGQDIDSLTSLRGFANYRFRGADATFFQTSYTLPVYDPLGLLMFYDGGNAGDILSALSFAHLRQDAGFGVNIRIMRVSYAQAYLAWGAGSGPYLGYNLVKHF